MLREISPARVFARPTADDLWLGPTQESALSLLATQASVRALLGPLSSGRTTLLRHLAEQPSNRDATLRVPGPQRRRAAVLKCLLQAAGLDTGKLNTDVMRGLFDVYLQERLGRGERVIIEVDDADGFGPAAWSEIQRLRDGAGLETGPELLLSLVHLDAASSPAADYVRSLQAPVLVVLSWMNANAITWYLDWRLKRFDLPGVFTAEAVRLIARCSRGCFASVDHICQMALLLLRNRAGSQVDVLLVREALRALRRQRQLPVNAPEAIEARVIVSRDGDVIEQTTVGDRCLIGRSKLNDLCLENVYLSRHHMAIIRGESGYYLSDLNSVNGVFLNGQRVHSAPVGDGDMLQLGPYRLQLVLEAKTGEPGLLPSGIDVEVAGLADTASLPVSVGTKSSHLKVIK